MYGSLLVPMILDKLPLDIRKSIIRNYGKDNLTLENLRNAITREIEINEPGTSMKQKVDIRQSLHVLFLPVLK